MEKNEKYISPECEEIELKMEGCIAGSVGGEVPPIPGEEE